MTHRHLPPSDPQAAIYLLRHGQVASHEKGRRYIGWTDIALTDAGQEQAAMWAEFFSGSGLCAIHSSDLSRCMDTAQIIGKALEIPVTATPAFREIHLGQWEGIGFDEIKASQPERFHARGRRIADFRPPDGESFEDLAARAWPELDALSTQRTGPILIVTHAGVIRVILCRILGMPLANLFRIAIDPGGLVIIGEHAGQYQLRTMNRPPR